MTDKCGHEGGDKCPHCGPEYYNEIRVTHEVIFRQILLGAKCKDLADKYYVSKDVNDETIHHYNIYGVEFLFKNGKCVWLKETNTNKD